MNSMMMASFVDEFLKIATLSVTSFGSKSTAGGASSSISQGARATPTIKAMQPQTKLTDYTQVNKSPSGAALGTADAAKAVPTPPVIA